MEEFDYVIVGGGSAGSVLAARLTEDASIHVLVLEAGPQDRHALIRIPAGFPQLFQSKLDWNYRTEPQSNIDNRKIYWPRGKTLGGSSSINAMMWVRGMKADYDRWAELAGPSWSYESVLPYFLRIESTEGEDPSSLLRGTFGPLPVSRQRDPNPLTKAWIKAARQSGLAENTDPNTDQDEGVGIAMVNQKNGRRVSTADAYLRPARRRPNLTIRTDAECQRIIIDNGVAIGVDYRHRGRAATAHARREIVSCAGAIGSPLLLMKSGIGPGEMLHNHGVTVVTDRELVGKRLQDHLTAGVVFSTKGKARTLAKAQSLGPILRYLTSHRGLLSSNIAEGYGFIYSSPELLAPDLELLFVPGPFLDEGLTLTRKNGITVGSVLLQPKSHGEVRLARNGREITPSIDPCYLSDRDGLDTALLTTGVRRSLEILAEPAIASFVGQPVQPTATDVETLIHSAVHNYAQTLYHPVGTCAMGIHDRDVVDPELRVRGVDRLRVVDASIIPQIIRGHTHAPTVMVAEKAADLVRSGTRQR